MLWVELEGQGKWGKSADILKLDRTKIKYEEYAYTSIRRFVVVKALEGHCLCLLVTY
jgi:hypothetical protein